MLMRDPPSAVAGDAHVRTIHGDANRFSDYCAYFSGLYEYCSGEGIRVEKLVGYASRMTFCYRCRVLVCIVLPASAMSRVARPCVISCKIDGRHFDSVAEQRRSNTAPNNYLTPVGTRGVLLESWPSPFRSFLLPRSKIVAFTVNFCAFLARCVLLFPGGARVNGQLLLLLNAAEFPAMGLHPLLSRHDIFAAKDLWGRLYDTNTLIREFLP